MDLYERIKTIAKSKGYSINRLEQEAGLPRSYIVKFKKIMPGADKLQRIADVLNVTVGYIINDENERNSNQSDLTKKDLKDIEKDLELIQSNITNGAALYYGGAPVELDEDSNAMLSNAIQIALMTIKRENKKKYNPYKNKKKEV